MSFSTAGAGAFRIGGSAAAAASGFSLIELLVVIAIIAILAGLMLPALSRAKQRTKVVRCVHNLKQLGAGMAMYVHDSSDRYPPRYVSDTNGNPLECSFTLGGRDPGPNDVGCVPTASMRPLFPYLGPSEVFHCTEDKGIQTSPCRLASQGFLEPTSWEAVGCSYVYNTPCGYWLTRVTMEDRKNGIAGKRVSWVPDPALYILVNEPPARSWYPVPNAPTPPVAFTHWHYIALNRAHNVLLGELKKDSHKFVSPILFVDGRAASHDFTRNIQADPYYPFEPTKDWVWYKPRTGL